MQLVERHVIRPNHKYYAEADSLSFLAKNLYNCALYIYRQNYFKGVGTNAIEVYHNLKNSVDYKALPAKISQNILGLVLKNWNSYISAKNAYYSDPSKFKGEPKIPRYKGSRAKQREDGRYVVIYNNQAVSKKSLKKHIAHPSGTNIYLSTKAKSIDEIRIVPRTGCYVIEVVYSQQESVMLSKTRVAAIDLGLNNLGTVTYNVPSLKSKIYDGRAVKSVNQYANKKNAQLRSLLPNNQYSSKRLERLWLKRNLQVEYYLHTTSRAIINDLVLNNIGLLVVGWNKDFKDSINLGRVTNQKFVAIPHKKLIEQLQYKGKLAGISVVLVNESYTSKCSALDQEPLEKQECYLGKRIKRGLFRTRSGVKINADVNGSLNIGRKVIGNEFISHPIGDAVVHPIRVKAYKRRLK